MSRWTTLPAEFTFSQLGQEKRFKFVLKGLLILITVYVALFFLLAEIIDPRAHSSGVSSFTAGLLFTDGLLDELESSITKMFVLLSNGITGLAMLIIEICAYFKGPTSTVHPVFSAGFPFFKLNSSIVLILVVRTGIHSKSDSVLVFY